MTHALHIDVQIDLKELLMKDTPVSAISETLGVYKNVVSKYRNK